MISTEHRPPPMGSEAKNTFVENSLNDEKIEKSEDTTPNYERWKVSFRNLLDEEEGSKTFYEFLETEQLGVLFECWYSCKQYRYSAPKKATAKEVYSRFVRIKDSRVPISDQARNNLALQLRANNVTSTLLSEIENEVFANLRDICYPKFLKSDFFTFYCETSGQVRYDPSDFHKFGKPSKRTNLDVLYENGRSIDESNDLQSTLTPNEKECTHRTPTASKNFSDTQSLHSGTINDSDKLSMADSRISGVSAGYQPRSSVRSCNHDQLPELPNFRPRTQRLNQERLRAMKPDQFAAQLVQKLQKVIKDREIEKQQLHDTRTHHNDPGIISKQYTSNHYEHEYDASEFDTQSWVLPPAFDRYSVAGASSHSGSGANIEKYKNIKDKAKELRNAVHHSLRNNLGECQCQACFDRIHHEKLYSEHHGASCCQHDKLNCTRNCRYTDPQACCCRNKDIYCESNLENVYIHKMTSESSRNRSYTDEHNAHFDTLPVDKSKIYAWMEKNENYKNQYPEPAPSPALRRKKQPVVYDNSRTSQGVQPIAQDLGMPLLPQPDTGNVLEEVKRVLEEPIRGSAKKHYSPRTHPHQLQSTGYYPDQHKIYPDQHSVYSDASYERNGSAASLNWSHSDSASLLSYNPSQVSTVPSSASRLWNRQGYYESRSDVRTDQQSDARSHSTGRHSSLQGSATKGRSNVRSDYHSDVRSHSTGRSHGSDKGRSKNVTTVTYYFGVEPIPYRITIPTHDVTLGQFKQETKKGSYRFFFKTIDDDGEVVYDEMKDDDQLLPRYEDKIIGKVEKLE